MQSREQQGAVSPGLGWQMSQNENGSQALNHSGVLYLFIKADRHEKGKEYSTIANLKGKGFLSKPTQGKANPSTTSWFHQGTKSIRSMKSFLGPRAGAWLTLGR